MRRQVRYIRDEFGEKSLGVYHGESGGDDEISSIRDRILARYDLSKHGLVAQQHPLLGSAERIRDSDGSLLRVAGSEGGS